MYFQIKIEKFIFYKLFYLLILYIYILIIKKQNIFLFIINND